MSKNIEKQYLKLLKDILENGVEKQDRTGTGTISVFGRQIRHKMSKGFPLLTTKKMYWKGIVTELLWFLRGDTNIKYLVDNDCHIWDGDAFKNYISKTNEFKGNWPDTMEEFINKIKTDDAFARRWGELGKIYGTQWRRWSTYPNRSGEYESNPIDQIQNLIRDLKTNPDSRRLMVSAWNVGELDQMTLPPCHYGFQVYTRELSEMEKIDLLPTKKGWDDLDTLTFKELLARGPQRAISLMWNQRSVDTFLGLPFNIASYGLLLEIIAKEVNMVPDELIGNLGDVHLYKNHIDQAREQIGRELSMEEKEEWCRNNSNHMDCPMYTREPFPLPTLKYTKSLNDVDEVFKNLEVNQFEIENYQSHSTIKAPLSN